MVAALWYSRDILKGLDMKCPNCGYDPKPPTQRQIEAYRLTRFHGFTQEQAGAIMGIRQDNICRLLCRLKNNHPSLFIHEKLHRTRKKPFYFNEEIHSLPKMKF